MTQAFSHPVSGRYAEAECRYSLAKPNVIDAISVRKSFNSSSSSPCLYSIVCLNTKLFQNQEKKE